MGCLFSIVRAVASLILGVVVFVGFLFLLILNNFSDKLLSADFYKDTISGQDAYNRIYDEVLVDKELSDKTAEILGDIKVVTHQDIVDLTRKIIPPAYIQTQVEGAIDRTVDYMNEDEERLELYVDLIPPLENVKTVMFSYMDSLLDALEEENPGAVSCSVQGVTGLGNQYVEKFEGIANGEVPTAILSLQALDPLCRQLLFTTVFDLLLVTDQISPEVAQGFVDNREELREPFTSGDTKGVLKIAARSLAGPLMDEAIDKVREDLTADGRLDLIKQLADWDNDITEAELRSNLNDGRDWVSKAREFGDLTTMLMVIGGSVLIGLVHFPHLSSMLRWPGMVLLFTGVFFFVVGKIAESEVPDRLTSVIETGADQATNVPPAVTDLGGDILVSFGTQMTDGFTGPSLSLLILGAILFGSSFFVWPIKRFIPFVK